MPAQNLASDRSRERQPFGKPEWITRTSASTLESFAMRRSWGVLHSPVAHARSVVVAGHFSHDFSDHYLAEPLASRGYAFLGWNNRFIGVDEFFRADHALDDIGTAVSEMRERFDHVILLGNSGGGSLMAAYQSAADGAELVQAPLREIYGGEGVSSLDLNPADAFIALNAHESRAKILTEWIDPSVVDEHQPLGADPDLDLWGPTAGMPPYSPEFVTGYRHAQRARNARITAWVQAERELRRRAGVGERVFGVYRTWADPRFLDLEIDPSDRGLGCYLGADVRAANYGAYGLARCVSLGTWLGVWSLEYDVLDTKKHLPRVLVPSLIIQGTADAGVYPSNARGFYETLGSANKDLVWIEGGTHYFSSQPDLVESVADAIADWLEVQGFPPAT